MRYRKLDKTTMPTRDTSTPVVILASPHHGGLGVTRSLGRLGIPVFNVDSSRWTPALFSKYCQGKFVWDIDQAPPEQSVERLVDIARLLGGRPVLIPTTDSAAILVADYAAALREWYIFPDQSRRLVRSLSSKKEMYFLAKKLRVATPDTHFFKTKDDLLERGETLKLPIMIKAIDGQLPAWGNKKKLIIRTPRELLDFYDSVDDKTVRNLAVQEYIQGGEDDVWMFNGYFNERSECLAGFTGRKLRQCPAYTGVTSLGMCQENEDVASIAEDLMETVGYRGIVDIDFRYDARDGQYKVLDVNPRIGSTFRLFVSDDGMDVARALYLDMTGQPVTAVRACPGRKWIVEDFDLVALFRYRRDGKLTFGEWLRSLRGVRESAFFAMDDLVPMLLMLRADVGEMLRRFRPRSLNTNTAAAVPSAPDERNVCC